ncbi:unextended protein-like [Bolinopsis microptera]|uniref:unextended protein-like n=1 Tax=Bolinopsis microptera TaxID=2820187 RepID=UPI00307ACA4D
MNGGSAPSGLKSGSDNRVVVLHLRCVGLGWMEDLDPVYVPIGVVTLEDIIEEIIQQEIVDETDAYVNNDFKKKNEKKCFPLLPIDKKKDQHVMKISPQLELATFTFLSTQVPEFSEENISPGVLNRLLRQDVIKEVKPDGKPVIESGVTVNFMAMILTGELKIEVGREKMIFVQGPFSTFCIPALSGPYVPDITVLPSDVRCQYLCIHRDEYRRAIETCEFVLQEKTPVYPRSETDLEARSPNGLSPAPHSSSQGGSTGGSTGGLVDPANSRYHVCCNDSAV